MNFNTDGFARFDHYSVQFADEVMSKTSFQGTLTEDDQVLEVGCGTGHFARRFMLTRSKPCRKVVATDFDPAMIDFAREHYSHEDIAYETLDIVTSNLTPFLERHGTFDRVLCFWVFHMIQDQKAAYANVAKLLKDHGECLVVAFSSLDTMDVWRDVYNTPKWKGRIPDPQNVFNASINYNRVKSASQVEAEVRDTLRGTGLHCISCEVRDSSWKFESMEYLLASFLLRGLCAKALTATREYMSLQHRFLVPHHQHQSNISFSDE
ncbi:hypothetical protein HPB50_002071 [Hyalomma asiaticum]|uniref:Uncharacterized protein n=1 Tax=Hyalomma asiaticum TaxID=266040 RepID=A0ACB7T7M3_HYAAI|nr:hypothetical protein HPB50_002071 [Hyalomma asiaticum]